MCLCVEFCLISIETSVIFNDKATIFNSPKIWMQNVAWDEKEEEKVNETKGLFVEYNR